MAIVASRGLGLTVFACLARLDNVGDLIVVGVSEANHSALRDVRESPSVARMSYCSSESHLAWIGSMVSARPKVQEAQWRLIGPSKSPLLMQMGRTRKETDYSSAISLFHSFMTDINLSYDTKKTI